MTAQNGDVVDLLGEGGEAARSARMGVLEKGLVAGLQSSGERRIPTYYCYNDTGSSLFEKLRLHRNYYLSRTEEALLASKQDELVALIGHRDILELGAGTSEKLLPLVQALGSEHNVFRFFNNDVNEMALQQGQAALKATSPHVQVLSVLGDYYDAIEFVAQQRVTDRSIAVFFIGSTIGNFLREERQALFDSLHRQLKAGDLLVLACDLFKDVQKLNDAYNNNDRIIEQIELSALTRINEMYGGTFDTSQFSHQCVFNRTTMGFESRLFSLTNQSVVVRDLEIDLYFAEADSIFCDFMWKPTLQQFTGDFDPSEWSVRSCFLSSETPYCIAIAEVI